MDDQETMRVVAEAYGWLWHETTTDRRTHMARQLLRELLGKDMMVYGINAAKEAGAYVRPWE